MTSLINKIKGDLKLTVSESRYKHSLRVRDKILALAENNMPIKRDQLEIISLMHDFCKGNEEYFLKIYGDRLDDLAWIGEDLYNPFLIHGPLAALVLRDYYKVDHEEMFRAICMHTSGDPYFDLMGKLLFIADKIEDARQYPGIEEIRTAAKSDIDLACFLILKNNMFFLLEREQKISPHTIQWYNQYIKEQKEGK